MGNIKVPRILLGATGSGAGKTTFTCGLLKAIADRGLSPVSYKCGPDYIDPMFHTEVMGIPSRNIDLFFMDKSMAEYMLTRKADNYDIAVIEGVMGYYDGLAGVSTDASSYDVAVKTKTPAILLVDGRGRSLSLLAEIKGFMDYRRDAAIKGVIINRASAMIYRLLKEQIEKDLGVEVLGYIPVMKDCSLESRHLGLITAGEIANLQEIIGRIAERITETVDVERIIEIAGEAEDMNIISKVSEHRIYDGVKIGVARDKAFCFYYEDNIDLLKSMGAEIRYFSPLEDTGLDKELNGLIFGGGYPELYLEKLAANKPMLHDIRCAINDNIPCLAECGGFMYLHERIKDRDGNAYNMVGVIDGETYPGEKLGRFGYIELTAEEDSLLCRKGEIIRGHEFHYWDSTNTGRAYTARKPISKREWDCIISRGNLQCGYPHIHFYSNVNAAENFIKACSMYENKTDREKS